MIRELREEDAEATARLILVVNPHRIETGELVWARATKPHQRDWIAESAGTVVGHAYAGLSASTKGRFWIGVHPEQRGRGIGSELYRAVEEHLTSAARLRTWVDGDSAGERFVRQRGFEQTGADRVSDVDPRAVDRAGLPELKLGSCTFARRGAGRGSGRCSRASGPARSTSRPIWRSGSGTTSSTRISRTKAASSCWTETNGRSRSDS